MHRQKTGHGSGAGTVSPEPNARSYPEYGNYRLVMKASIVPQDGSRKSQKSPGFADGGKIELYEIKWEKFRNPVLRQDSDRVLMKPVWCRQTAVCYSGVNFSKC